jgi:hypothetical protein
MAKLRLGPIPDDKPVTRTIKLSATLDADLRRYAELYAASYGAVTVERLIPAMLERFILSDRGFRGLIASREERPQGVSTPSGPPERPE